MSSRAFTARRLALAVTLCLALASSANLVVAGDIALDDVGSGRLLRRSAGGFESLPLLDMRVDLTVTGIMVHGKVAQEFSNPTEETIDALYVFPLPERAAVNAMEMWIGDRRIVATVKEREEAKATYDRARKEGKKAALLEEKRPNLFTTSVANINPGETIRISLEYLEEISYRSGAFGLAFPLTFTPRYKQASNSADTADEFCEDDKGDDRATDLYPTLQASSGTSAPHAVIHVEIDAGVAIDSVTSPSHPIHTSFQGRRALVEPSDGAVPADRDFVLSWRVHLGRRPEGTLFVEDREDGRYGLMMLFPPGPDSDAAEGLPTETLFIVDVSGSMGGPSITQARDALLAALGRLRPGDTFDILKFNDRFEAFRGSFQDAGGPALDEARQWVRSLAAGGGTEILPALVRGLDLIEESRATVARRIVLVTDAAVDNEDALFHEITGRLHGARLHVVGIGSAPNRHLVRKMAQFGRGSYEFIANVDDVERLMGELLLRIDRPVMTDVSVDWHGAPPLEAYPALIPDLYADEPLLVSLKLGMDHPGATALLNGRVVGGASPAELPIAEDAPKGCGIATRWARAKVDALIDSLNEGASEPEIRREVVEVAKLFNLVTRYTSLVAVEDRPSAAAESARRLHVANGLPFGSSMAGELPQGGTSGPLAWLFGAVLTVLGAAGFAAALVLVLGPRTDQTRFIHMR